jgi:putative ABC transport system ATP-binding protein/lipoprotein-releasing system ATP-binding protein
MIQLQSVKKKYAGELSPIEVLKGINLEIQDPTLVTLMGPSGSGKSTLLHILGAIDLPDEGMVHLFGKDITKFNEKQRTLMRRNDISIIFQFFHLLPYLNAIENISVPLFFKGFNRSQAFELSKKALNRVGLSSRGHHKPNNLSGGEQQRVAIARSIASNSKLILADEPTGNLDTENSEKIFQLIQEIQQEMKSIFFIVTHNPDIGILGERRFKMIDGNLSEEN